MTTAYRAAVTDTVAEVELTPTANHARATVRVDGTEVARGASHALDIERGRTATATFVVTAQDGVTTNGYTVAVTRDELTVGLVAFAVSTGTLMPAFDDQTLAYTLELPNEVTRVTVTGTPRGTATVAGDDMMHTEAFSRVQNLEAGMTTKVTVVVTRTVRDVEYSRTYTLEVTRRQIEVTVQVGVFMQGAYDRGSDRMRTTLIGNLPASQPYQAAPWNAPSLTAPGLSAGDFGLAGVADTVVDWVLVELRTAPRGTTEVPTDSLARQAALVLSDGAVAGVDGDALRLDRVAFPAVSVDGASEDLYVLIHHRNHLSVMATATAVGCAAGADYCADFRSRPSYRNRQAALGGGSYAMFAGDVDGDNDIDADDETLIRLRNLQTIGVRDYQTPVGGSYGIDADLDFDGTVLSADRYYIILNTSSNARAPACAACAIPLIE